MRGRQEGRPAGGLHRPRGRQGSVHVPRPRSGRRESARAQGVSRGQRLSHVLFFKEVARPGGTSGTKARPESGPCGECPRHLKRTPRPEPGCSRASGQKFVAQLRLRRTSWRRPRAAPRGRRGWVRNRTALPALAARGPRRLGSREPQPRSRRTDSPAALAATLARPRGGSGCTAGDVAGAASAPGTSSRDAPGSAPPTQRSPPCHPHLGGQCRCSCRLGRPGHCSGPATEPALRAKRPSLRARGAAARPAGSAPRGSSQARGKVARRGGGGGWWAEAVGGGGDSPPISKVESTRSS